jgi:Calcineurin-like phosphoesterase
VLDGGQLAALDFGLVGDTRPPFYDEVTSYPTQIIGTIFQDLAQVSPPISFVASTGDYMFAITTAVQQAQLYVDAGSFFPGPVYPAMGNHECGLALDNGNCFGQNTTDGNFSAYLTTILPGFGLPSANAYFMVTYSSSDSTNPWTAKFIYTAPNAWDDGQNSWVAATLAIPTTYTFFVRHEPTDNAQGAPGVAPTDAQLATAAFTLKLTGHSHIFEYDEANREVVNGLGGAALNTGYTGTYGYVICRQRADNAIQCSQYDYDTNQISTEPNSTFAVLADGGSTPPM